MKKFLEIENVPYLGKNSKEMFSFRYYNKDEILLGKKMKDHLRFAMSYWHTINASGTDMFGGDTMNKNFEKEGMEKYKAKADFAFELMQKLGIEYYCFHDVDIAPEKI